MQYRSCRFAVAPAAAALLGPGPALAQKQGGTLRMYLWDSPPSASIQEEATVSTTVPFMAVFNNLVLYDQHKKLNTHGHHPARARHQLGVGRRPRPSSPSSCATT